MRKVYLLFILLITGLASASAQTPVIGVSFGSDPNNLVLTGTAAEGRTGKSYKTHINNRWIYRDPLTGKYIGTTDNDTYGFYYVMYDADDDIGRTFSGNTITWELLFRLDKKECYSYDNDTGKETANGTAKFFSCQESGGGGGGAVGRFPIIPATLLRR